MGLFGVFQSGETRGVLEKDETETKWVDWDRTDNGPSGFRRYGFDQRRGKGWGRGATTPGGRGVIFMLTEGDGCDSADSHVPRGVRLVLTFPSWSSPLSVRPFALLCPLLSFNIWSLFSISNTRAPAMTPLLKMPRIGKVFFWVFLFFLFQGLREPAFTAWACLRVRFFFSRLQVLFLWFCSICSARHRKPNTAKLLSR